MGGSKWHRSRTRSILCSVASIPSSPCNASSPRTALKLQLQPLADGARSVPPVLAAKLQRFDLGVEHLHRILEQLLDLSRTEGRCDHGISATSVKLTDTVHCVTELSQLAGQRDIAIGGVAKSKARVAGDSS